MPTLKKKAAPKTIKPAKQTVKLEDLYSIQEIKTWHIDKVPVGSVIFGTIRGEYFQGRLQKVGNEFFICQDIKDGDACKNKFGFLYSYSIRNGSQNSLIQEEVVITNVILDPEFKYPNPPKPLKIDGNIVVFKKGYVVVGCTEIENDIVRKIYEQLID